MIIVSMVAAQIASLQHEQRGIVSAGAVCDLYAVRCDHLHIERMRELVRPIRMLRNLAI
ncbi:hypothetical protein [Thiothrix lacustris]|uniref:hypothetical protein n=1 Tax=Thiothrix lacustris TaxID=525917 RepID=UPI0027E3D544|nr:hypothetical protein [Thiothrix lacustris]WMP17490.1 hypothetical protein RCS87_19235 [Thiothrix lacustris]